MTGHGRTLMSDAMFWGFPIVRQAIILLGHLVRSKLILTGPVRGLMSAFTPNFLKLMPYHTNLNTWVGRGHGFHYFCLWIRTQWLEKLLNIFFRTLIFSLLCHLPMDGCFVLCEIQLSIIPLILMIIYFAIVFFLFSSQNLLWERCHSSLKLLCV